jgi:peroxiredoxin
MKSRLARLSIATLLIASLAGLGALWWHNGAAPDVEFVSLKGERLKLRDLQGHPVLVSFWASDCRPCLEEFQDLAALHQDYAARGFKLIAVAMSYDLPSHVVELARIAELPYAIALDPLGEIAAAFGDVRLVPNSFLIGPDGRIALHRLGRIAPGELRALIEPMLREN